MSHENTLLDRAKRITADKKNAPKLPQLSQSIFERGKAIVYHYGSIGIEPTSNHERQQLESDIVDDGDLIPFVLSVNDTEVLSATSVTLAVSSLPEQLLVKMDGEALIEPRDVEGKRLGSRNKTVYSQVNDYNKFLNTIEKKFQYFTPFPSEEIICYEAPKGE